MTPDMINGLFELFGAFLLMINVHMLYKHKRLNGVHWAPTVFFTTWGLWNLYYYPSLDQWFSFYGGLLIVLVDIVWLCQVWYYAKNGKPKDDTLVEAEKVFNEELDRGRYLSGSAAYIKVLQDQIKILEGR